MTKKHFIALADTIRTHLQDRLDAACMSVPNRDKQGYIRLSLYPVITTKDAYEIIVTTLADFCASQNPQFNRERWLEYINK